MNNFQIMFGEAKENRHKLDAFLLLHNNIL